MSTEQEYDAQADLMHDLEGEEIDSDNFIPNFRLRPRSPTTNMGLQGGLPLTSSAPQDCQGGIQAHMIDPYDPILDADPFGLTASMHFPNPFPVGQHSIRR